ncbi:MAG: hypothetical protein ACI8XV_000198 [Arenicella sp.]|jgi:hypothetical protein
MTYFENNDPLWEETAAFLQPLIADTSLIVGPEAFVNALPNVLAYDLLGHFSPDFFDFTIIHKGECLAIGNRYLEAWEQHYFAIFANPVFVVFTKHKSKEIERESDDFKALAAQINGLPPEPTLTHTSDTNLGGTENLDFRPIVDFLKSNSSEQDLIFAPKAISVIFENALDEQAILRTSLNTASFVVLSVKSASEFPYQDLKNIALSFKPVFSNEFFAVFTRHMVTGDKQVKEGFAEVVQTAMQDDDYLLTLKLYRDMLVGDTTWGKEKET